MSAARRCRGLRSRALAPAWALAASLALAVAGPPTVGAATEGETREAPAGERATIDAGHVDIGPRFADGEWAIGVRDDTVTTPTWRQLENVVLAAVEESRISAPEGEEFSFLGEPGASVWLLPQVEEQGLLWPGWNTQDLEVAERVDRDVTWTLHGLSGPGRFTLFETEGFGEPRVLFDSAAPLPQTLPIGLDTHVHGNWTFSEPGVYVLDVEMSATVDGGEPVAAREGLRFLVGDGDPEVAFAAAGPAGGEPGESGVPVWVAAVLGAVALALGGSLALRRRRRRGSAEQR